MNGSRNCEGCLNDTIRLTGGTEGDAFNLCRATIGETYFQDFKDRCFACAMLAELGLQPDSCQKLVARWKLLRTAPSAPDTTDSAPNEGHNGLIYLT